MSQRGWRNQTMSKPKPGRWHAFDPMMPWGTPDAPGVYVVFLDGEPVYIGQSNSLRARLARHSIRYGYANNIITPWGDFPAATNVTGRFKLSRRYGDWAMLEIRLIRRLRPRFNNTFVKPRRRAA